MTELQKKRLSVVLVTGILAVLLIGGLVLYGSVESLTKKAVERLASQSLGVRVKIGSLDIHPEKELVVMTGISIANPEGYPRGPAVMIGSVNMDARSLRREELILEDIKVSDMTLYLEVAPPGTNLSSLRNNATARLASRRAGKAPAPVKIIIDHIVFTGTRLEPNVKQALAEHLSPVTLPEIHMRAIGQQENGLAADEVGTRILDRVVEATLRTAAREKFLDQLSPEARKQIGAVPGPGEEFLEGAKEFLGQANSEAEMLGRDIRKIFKVNE